MRWFREKRFDAITIADIRRLVEENTRESLHLEYKRDLTADGHVRLNREIGKDISAFANTEGGDFIVGVEELKDDDRLELVGVDGTRDGLERKVGDLVRDNIAPRIRFQVKAIPLGERFVVFVRIPRSLDAPHRNEGQNERKFWRRHPNGAVEMTTEEVRDTVLQRRDIHERAVAWRDARIAMHESGDVPVKLKRGPRLYIHGFPIGLGDDALALHTEVARNIYAATPITCNAMQRSFFGAFVHDGQEGERPERLDAWMNSGAFESAWNIELSGEMRATFGPDLEGWIEERSFSHLREIQKQVGPVSWLLMVSLSKVKSIVLKYFEGEASRWRYEPVPAFSIAEIRCPPVYLPEIPTDQVGLREVLMPTFHRIAQAANRAGSPDWRRQR